MTNKTYAIIPARGGSKGIHQKNLSRINGRSLVEIGVTTCLSAAHIDGVFVSTDDSDIDKEAKRFGADVIIRPEGISGDAASSEEAILHALSEIKDVPSTILFYQITNPFTLPKDIDAAIEHFIKSRADSLFTASLFTHFLWKRVGENMVPINHDYKQRMMRQEISNCFLENGAFYIMNRRGFIKNKNRFFGKVEMFKMNEISSYEIDEPSDLKIARVLYNER